jgi:hypothetical protein
MRSFINCILYEISNQGRVRRAGHVARMGEIKNAYRTVAGRHGGKRIWEIWVCIKDKLIGS